MGKEARFPFSLSCFPPSPPSLRFAPATQLTLEEVTTHEDVLRASSSGGISDELKKKKVKGMFIVEGALS